MNIRRGDIYYADLSPVVGSEQGGIRPVLIIQNNVGNRHSPTAVSYTHLDVYKRQGMVMESRKAAPALRARP